MKSTERTYFKFQSDSINTHMTREITTLCVSTLNSNLILLIQRMLRWVLSSLKSLNSNLILLILYWMGYWRWRYLSFKFQSDSINTITERTSGYVVTTFKFQSDSINTFPYKNFRSGLPSFKFQSDSINTVGRLDPYSGRLCFKFQSDSINTKGMVTQCNMRYAL